MNLLRRPRVVGSIKVGAAAVTVACLAVGAGMLTGQSPTSAATDPRSVESVHANADALYESFNGTVGQREASGVLQAWSLNGAMDQCMEAGGFSDWDWSRTRNGAPRTNSMDTSVFFARPSAHAYSNALMDMSDSLRAEEGLRAETLTPEEDAAVSTCLESTRSVSDETASVASTPAVARDLRDAWWSMLADVDARYGSIETYNECFASQASNLPIAGTDGDTWKAALSQYAPQASLIPRDKNDPLVRGGEWQEFLSLESALEAVDWECRADVYAGHISEVAAEVDLFERDHEVEIDGAARAWLEVEGAAQELGFHGQAGSLDGGQ